MKLRARYLSGKNQDVEPIFTGMKTKTIIVMLMFVLSWIATSGSSCVCPKTVLASVYKQNVETENDYRIQAFNISPFDSSDSCADCGHSGACCSAQNSSAVSSAVDLPGDAEAILVSYEPEAGFERIPDYVGTVRATRAPPPVRRTTLVSSHQLLLI